MSGIDWMLRASSRIVLLLLLLFLLLRLEREVWGGSLCLIGGVLNGMAWCRPCC